MMYVFFNPNPEGKSVGDCVIRAISKADGLYSMMGDAQNEAERGAIQDCINRLKS